MKCYIQRIPIFQTPGASLKAISVELSRDLNLSNNRLYKILHFKQLTIRIKSSYIKESHFSNIFLQYINLSRLITKVFSLRIHLKKSPREIYNQIEEPTQRYFIPCLKGISIKKIGLSPLSVTKQELLALHLGNLNLRAVNFL